MISCGFAFPWCFFLGATPSGNCYWGAVRWARGIEGPPPNQKYQMGSPPDTKKIKPGIPRDAPGDESVHEGSGPGGATPSGEAS